MMSDHTPTTSPDSETGTGVQIVRPLEYFSKRDQVLALEAVWMALKSNKQASFAELAAMALNKIHKAAQEGKLGELYDGWTRDYD